MGGEQPSSGRDKQKPDLRRGIVHLIDRDTNQKVRAQYELALGIEKREHGTGVEGRGSREEGRAPLGLIGGLDLWRASISQLGRLADSSASPRCPGARKCTHTVVLRRWSTQSLIVTVALSESKS